MKLHFLIILSVLLDFPAFSQSRSLTVAMEKLAADEQFANASIALSVREAETGMEVYQLNGNLGVNPASSQKVVTSASAFQLLGKEFRFNTRLALADMQGGKGQMLVVTGGGDPTLGSDRWKYTRAEQVFSTILNMLKQNNVKELPGGIYIGNPKFSYQPLPHGWIWEDIGNYFGAGAWGFNWKENVFEIDMVPGKDEGDPVTVTATRPAWMMETITSFVTTGERGSGDKSLVFSAPYQQNIFITGSVPAGSPITISGSLPDPAASFGRELSEFLQRAGIICGEVQTLGEAIRKGKVPSIENSKQLADLRSPPLDSMNYWFMNKSINLYGEAFVKMIALQQNKEASTTNGIDIVREFWKEKGIAPGELKIGDGSGLSPTNRVTSNGLVKVMEYAQTRPWFNSFYAGIPTMNNMKLKSGYMQGVRSYTGIITSRGGKKYLVAFVINNFHGSPAAVRQKMWKVLDELL